MLVLVVVLVLGLDYEDDDEDEDAHGPLAIMRVAAWDEEGIDNAVGPVILLV